ncbi:TetR/AcrR family transcriptional regulator [Novosphingobium sp. JCM 18896]|uniref:TetR/AcrR family transcriptional regulator n=1 Tax=Novosphingobium sp. JCM 18896 TaxID=2989731 RepID=UPI0022231018|nr:TetR/AcrR family transcriptional regulator [Novosphingobium sp. JCM 18896]MCW1431070.1 TetR/AcrR family transcriptional regulator [Novosphingobium sp. JCM 18896]
MNSSNQPPSPRSSKAEATRAAILKSARRLFAAHGYDGVGLRGIAEGAGVTAMMIGRYFGSKEGLFGDVVTDSMRDPVILSEANLAAPDIARRFAEALIGLTGEGAEPLDGFLILFRSTASPVAARIARERILAAHQATAQDLLKGQHAAERAAIFLSIVAGFQMNRQMLQLDPLVRADPALLIELMTRVFEAIFGAADKR